MKKNILKLLGRTLISAATFVVISAVTFSNVSAQPQLISNSTITNEMEIKVLETDAEKILLNIKMQNPEGSNFTLFITDENDNELLSKNYTEKSLDIPVRLMRSDDIKSFKIGIRSANKKLYQNYSIVPTVKYIPEVVISRK